MRIFASWSGDQARQIAELLKTWIPAVIQDAEVYVSSNDIGKGSRWLSSVTDNLSSIDFGIIVVTKNNINAPWILFEAGALSKSVNGVVIPLLCGVESLDAATSPLSQFQYAKPTFEDIRDLIVRVNTASAKPLGSERLEAAFAKWWPDFETQYGGIELDAADTAKKGSQADKLSSLEDVVLQLLSETRQLGRRVDGLIESKRPTLQVRIPRDENGRWVTNVVPTILGGTSLGPDSGDPSDPNNGPLGPR